MYNRYLYDENTMLWSQLINTVSNIPGVSDFMNVRPENVFYKLLKTIYYYDYDTQEKERVTLSSCRGS